MKRKILVVDDDPAIIKLLEFYLMSSGFEVLTAQNGEEFRQKAFTEKPDVIVLDIMLGETDGAVLYQDLLLEGLSSKTPVVFLSALAHDISPTPPRPGRTYSLLGKPFDPEQLAEKIACLVQA